MKSALLILAVCAASVAAQGTSFCYWGSWSIYRDDKGAFGIDQLPTDLCTHLVWTFLSVEADTADIFEFEPEDVNGEYTNNITQFLALKEGTDLKMVVAAGGWSAGSTNFSIIANNDTLRATYVANTVAYLEQYRFDGFALDWEYPNTTDYEAYVTLLQDFKTAFGEKYELSIAVSASTSYLNTSYNVPAISDIVDYIGVMSYDYHGIWDTVTGVNAPLYDQLTDAEGTDFNVNVSVRAWIDAGADPAKILLGLGTYGKSFNLTSLTNATTGASYNAAGEPGPYTASNGSLAYYEICLDQLENEWDTTEVRGNYAYGNRDYLWVGYDNIHTMYAKGQYAKSLGLGGIMFWSVDQDDFADYCGTGTYPLIKAGINGYKG